jgi:glucose/arabinose dehydrogenase
MKRLITLIVFVLPLVLVLSACSLAEEKANVPTPAPEFPWMVSLRMLVDAEVKITSLTHAGDGSGRLFLTTRTGQIRIIEGGKLLSKPFLDIRENVDSASIEQGLLSIAFDPDYTETGEFYVYYTNLGTDNDTIVARYRVSADENIADPDSEQVILFLEQPANNHNVGQLQFGPDNYLYVALGDGGKGNDPWGHGQNAESLFGAILRLGVRGKETYVAPPDNPFISNGEGAAEVWVYGLRNPWRFSFDRLTGDVYIADVGQNLFEELNFSPSGQAAGSNFGWNVMEGQHCFRPKTNCDREGLVLPIVEYQHGEDGCAIVGGYVYRGSDFPQMIGTYYFADYCSGDIWGAARDASGTWSVTELLDTEYQIVSFGEDEAGELYVLELEGRIFRLLGAP